MFEADRSVQFGWRKDGTNRVKQVSDPVSRKRERMVARFPGPDDFQGDYKKGATVRTGAQAMYDGYLAVTLLDRRLVEDVLPGGFCLAPRKDGGNEHPIIHLIGFQGDPQAVVVGKPVPPILPGYREMMLLIPFVLREQGTLWHTFVVRMYLSDSVVAIGIGDVAYDYGKDIGEFQETGTPDNLRTEVIPLGRQTYFICNRRITGRWQSSGDAVATLPRWLELQKIFEMPLLGVNELNGRQTCSYWEWDYSQADVATVVSTHQFVRSFRMGMTDWPALGQLTSAPDGAIAIRKLRWRMAFPPPDCEFATAPFQADQRDSDRSRAV